MTTAVSGWTRREAHARRSRTISLATGGERRLRRPRAPRPPGPCSGPAQRPRRGILPAPPSAASAGRVHRKNGILQILLWEAELGSDHCRREERGRRLLKQQRPLDRRRRGPGRGWNCRNLTERRCAPSAPQPPGGRPRKRGLWGKGGRRSWQARVCPCSPPEAPPELRANAGSCEAAGKRIPGGGEQQDRCPPGTQPISALGCSVSLQGSFSREASTPPRPPTQFPLPASEQARRLHPSCGRTNLMAAGAAATASSPLPRLVPSRPLLLLRPCPLPLPGSRHLLLPWNKGFPWKLRQWFPPALK